MAPRESAASFFTVVATASGDIEIQRPPVSTVIGTAVGVITPGNWHVIECKFIVASSPNGSVEVYVDGVQVLNLTGINTSYFGTNVLGLTWAGAYTTGAAPSGTGEDYAAYDDLYLFQVDANTPNDYLGTSYRVESLPPNGDDTVQWDQTGGGSHYQDVDENPASSTDNVYTSTDAEVEMFDMTNSTLVKYTHAVKVEVEAIDNIDAGANNIDVRIDSNGTVSETNHNVTNTGAYAVFTHLEGADDPDTGSAWSIAAINALKIGIQYNT
jgi:hypothetical protein